MLFQLSGCIVCGFGLWAVLDSWELVSITPGHVYQVRNVSNKFTVLTIVIKGNNMADNFHGIPVCSCGTSW